MPPCLDLKILEVFVADLVANATSDKAVPERAEAQCLGTRPIVCMTSSASGQVLSMNHFLFSK
jgi:hypothetical protein